MSIPWGKVGFAVRELMPEILALTGKGKNLSEIHREFLECGKLDGGYSTFALHVRRFLKNPDPQNVVPLPIAAEPAKKKKKNPSSNHEPPKFEYNRNVDLDYLLSPADGPKPKEESEQ